MIPPFARGAGRQAPGISPGGLLPSALYPGGVASIFEFQNAVASISFLVLLALKIWALVDALLRPAEAYEAAGKLTKPAWLLILGLAVGAALVFPSVFGLLGILGIVAALVYVLDVRPALVSVTRRR
ncbi:uncharacterized protein DUF2516 [Nocardioides aurantiacus]|uniref:Uncharacterized protein DUF2516 n=1 Tax=Nocardioides aurantiacus TaxID=86796 RepID=A0A3N2CYK5_9ACTN|nr:uncharacterized protein DUF2516 [Nocardioides aurantiacus]